MKTVQPIRDKSKIEQMKTELRKTQYKNYFLFMMGINTGLRISDLLPLKVEDVRDKKHIVITEKKTGKEKRFLINDMLKKEIDQYIEDKQDNRYLFESNKGYNHPISRVQAYRALSKAGEKCGLDDIGTHSLRKSFGYWHYKMYKDVAVLQDIFNHSSPSVTLRYIGINQDVKDQTIEKFFL
ncbi:site-specific integrase [Lutibacter sp. B2]|nr:site-specific integrase [Lutibacter sp. B2]